MKRITRAIVFTALALLVTFFWNKGFKISLDPYIFIKTTLIIAFFYYFVVPISRLVFLPLNFLTLGLLSALLNFALFYFYLTRFTPIRIEPWTFPELNILGYVIHSFKVGSVLNMLFSSLSLSFIIRLLELLI